MKLHRHQPILRSQQGQSIAEFLVVSSVLVPMILMIASFANLLDVQVTATKAARFAAWEGTVYQNVSSTATKTRINHLMLQNRAWSDFGPNQASVSGKYPSVVNLAKGVAFTGVCDGGCDSVGSGFTNNQNSILGQAAGLGQDKLKTVPISIPLSSDSALFKLVKMTGYRSATYTGLDAPMDDLAGEKQFHVEAVAPMVSGGGVAVNEESFTSVVALVSHDGTHLKNFERVGFSIGSLDIGVGTPLINALGFEEMASGTGDANTSTTSESQSTILPDYNE